MNKPKIGLLPLYVELYDRFWPDMRTRINSFHEIIVNEFKNKNLDVVTVPPCRIKSEFEEAVKLFENKNTDAVVTLHLAYSPSLESSKVLVSTKIPVIILDTTSAYDFSFTQEEGEILYNHGIHGVQDLCSVLRRSGKKFFIEAGHWKESDVLDRVVSDVFASRTAGFMRNARVGRFGGAFHGMGDFDVSPEILQSTIGIKTIEYDFNLLGKLVEEISPKEIDDEISYNIKNFSANGVDKENLRQSAIACLAVRRWIEREKLSAFTVNFLAVDNSSGLSCMPFLEAGKAMGRGIGYAGEGDILTAALVGALASVYPETSFTEMFCPDWKNNTIFLSHMGEMNINLTAGRPRLAVKDFPFTDASNPVVAYGRFKPGKASFVNLAPNMDNTYTLIVSPVEMLDIDGEDRMKESIHGWFRPSIYISDFLEAYSRAGGTHHAALVYGDKTEEIAKFGELMGWNIVKIK